MALSDGVDLPDLGGLVVGLSEVDAAERELNELGAAGADRSGLFNLAAHGRLGFNRGQGMNLSWREASASDLDLLADWNHQLIREEGHRNAMTVEQLRERMRKWLQGEYRAVVFSFDQPVAYALFKREEDRIYLRQFFVWREQRRAGIGRAAFALLQKQIWPSDLRLVVEVLCHNQPGVAFWHSVGYRDYCLTLEIMPQGAKK